MATLFRTLEQRKRFQARCIGSALATLIPLGVFIFFFLSADIGFKDSAAFVYRANEWGVTHPTGYPLMIIGSKLFTFLPFGSLAFKINFMSAVFGALTCLLLFHFFFEVTEHPPVSLSAALTFVLGQTFLSQAVQAEVYTLNTFFLAFLLVLWRRLTVTKSQHTFLLMSFIFGLALAHHITIVLFIPVVLLSLLLEREKLNIRADGLLFGLVFMLLPLTLYLFTNQHFSQSPYFQPDQSYLGQFFGFVLGQQYHHMLFALEPEGLLSRIGVYIYFLLRDYTLLVPLAGLAGLIGCMLRWPELLPPLVLFWLGHIVFSLNYAVADVEVFFLPTYLVLCIFVGFFYKIAFDFLSRTNPYLGTVFLVVIPLCFPLYLLVFQHGGALHSFGYRVPEGVAMTQHLPGYRLAKEYLEDLPPNAYYAIRDDWKHVWTLRYIHEVERWRDDVTLLVYEGSVTALQLASAVEDHAVFVEDPAFAERAGTKELILRRNRGVNVSDSIASFIDDQTNGTLLLVAEKLEGERILEESAIDALGSAGIPRDLLVNKDFALGAVGAVGAEERSAIIQTTETYSTLHVSQGTELTGTAYGTAADITINVGAWTMGNFANIFVDGRDFSPNLRGLNIVAMSPASRFVDASRVVNFDTARREILTRYEVVGTVNERGFEPTPKFLSQLDVDRLNMDYTAIEAEAPDEAQRFLLGWGAPEEWGRWVVGRNAYFAATFEEVLQQVLVIRTRTLPFEEEQSCEVRFNGFPIGSFRYPKDADGWITREFMFPPDRIVDGVNIFSFHFAKTKSPLALGISKDPRRLAAAFESFEVTAPRVQAPKPTPQVVPLDDDTVGDPTGVPTPIDRPALAPEE